MQDEYQQAVEELRTIRDLIRWGASLFHRKGVFFGHGTDNGFDEAAYLTLFALELPPQIHESYFDSRVTRLERERVVAFLKRRAEERLPAPYLTNEAWFAGLAFYVDERVLIPRSPLAEMIENRFEPWVDGDEVDHILDMCTGSACIAIACAAHFPAALVDATDISDGALEVASLNVERHGMEEQVRVIKSDLFDALEGEQYDVIVSNPPYVDAEDMAGLPDEFQQEPELALAAGDDGLDLVLHMLRDAPAHLSEKGILVVEVGNSWVALQEMFVDVPFYWLDFERGGNGVFLLTQEQLQEHHQRFVDCAAERTRL